MIRNRKVGPLLATALVASNMVGSGIFLLPATLASTGSITIIGWLIATAGALLVAVVLARLGRISPQAGGPCAYAADALGPYMGFQTTTIYWVSCWSGNIAIAVTATGYLASFLPILALPVSGAAATVGLIWLLTGTPDQSTLRQIAGVILVVAAIAILLGPWWLRIARDLVVERQARIRAEERADMAARLHDSVLQTLALIQRRAEHPQQVIQLARAQERELRAWLFDGHAPGSLDGQDLTLAAGILLIQQEVEAQHEVPVEAVTVGDCDLDDDLRALLAAAREATVNAVKWSGAPVVSIFAEVEPGQVALFVRDRGRGFDPSAVPPDRKGLAQSIHARMARRGGTVVVRTAPGQGTEVSLTMPRPAGERQPGRP